SLNSGSITDRDTAITPPKVLQRLYFFAAATRAPRLWTSGWLRSIGESTQVKPMARRRKTIPYKEILREDLKDPEYAAGYLNAVLEEGDDAAFLVALRDVAEAYGITDVSRRAELNREHVYTLLSAEGNPRLSSLSALLNAVGMKIQIAAKAHPV